MYVEFSYPEILSDWRDRSVIRWYLPPKTTGRPHQHELSNRTEHSAVNIAVLWGPDRSPNMLAVLSALYLRNREMLEQLVAVRQERGRVDFWCRSGADIKDVQRALEDAVEAVLWQRGAWKVNPGQSVPCKGALVDWEKLPENDPTLGAIRLAAKGQALGLITGAL